MNDNLVTDNLKIKCELYNDHFQNFKSYGIPKAQLILADVPYCYDSETECFTRNGWKKYDSILPDDEVLSLNHQTQRMEYSGISNIIVRDNDEDMVRAVEKLIALGGGITMYKDGKELGTHRLEIAGLMTDLPLEEVTKCLDEMHEIAERELEVNKSIDPFMTLCFMALPVIPSLKLTDCGLFDVDKFSFTDIAIKD